MKALADNSHLKNFIYTIKNVFIHTSFHFLRFNKNDFITLSAYTTIFVFLLIPSHIFASSCENYSATPPFLTTTVKPNVLFMLDNSGSMKTPIYNSGYKKDCTGNAGTGFNSSNNYYGLFDSSTNYEYDFLIPIDNSPYDGTTDAPYNITDASGNILIDTTATGAFIESTCTIAPGQNCWSGNFLNWLTTRRIDAARKALIGGKVESRLGYDYQSSGGTSWKIVGNNEPSDYSICKKNSQSVSYSPFPSNTKFHIYSPAEDGTSESLYDPYAKIEPVGLTTTATYIIKDTDGDIVGEWGQITDLTHSPQTITFKNTYVNPVIISKPMSYNGANTGVIRINYDTALSSNSFTIQVQEWEYENGDHTQETVSYFVFEQGTHTFTTPNGTIKLVAGSVSMNDNVPSFKTINNLGLSTKPVVITSVTSIKDSLAVTTRLKDITIDSFKVALQEEENQGIHETENVHYIAVEPGQFFTGTRDLYFSAGSQSGFNENFQNLNFDSITASAFIADIQTVNNTDPVSLRYKDFSSISVSISTEEEKSKDDEITHPNEEVGYLAIAQPSFNIALIVNEEPEGLVQSIDDKVRTGISFYKYQRDSDIYNDEWAHGGTLRLPIPSNPFVINNADISSYRFLDTPVKSDIADIIDAIEHYPMIWGTTPLAENLYEVGRYFSQLPPFYDDKPVINSEKAYLVYDDTDASSSNIWDPYIYTFDSNSQKVRCAKSFVILFTDGEPYRDDYVPSAIVGTSGGSGDYDGDNHSEDCSKTGNKDNSCDDNLDDVARYLYWDHKNTADTDDDTYRDLRSDLDGEQHLEIYTVAFGSNSIPQILQDTADNANGVAYAAEDGEQLNAALTSAITSILKKTSAGSSISVLSERASSGSLINQALFFPEKTFTDATTSTSYDVSWTGSLNAYWFYNTTTVSNIRENTTDKYDSVNSLTYFALDVYDDKVLDFEVDDQGSLKIKYYKTIQTGSQIGAADPNSATGGTAGPEGIYQSIDDVKKIFESGEILKNRTVYADPNLLTDSGRRYVYGVSSTGQMEEFVQSKFSSFADQFNLSSSDFPACLGPISTNAEKEIASKNLISYIRGTTDDFTSVTNITEKCRSRQVDDSGNLWKLGDIVYSTPKVVDYTYLNKKFSLLFTGSNDGMLHAFKIGKLRKDVLASNQTIALCDDSYGACTNYEIGKEAWSFIPRNVMPYLKYQTDPAYKHIYTVDLPPYIIEFEGKTILIGGLRFGGANGCYDGNNWCGDTTIDINNDSNSNPYQAVPPQATVNSIKNADSSSFITTPPATLPGTTLASTNLGMSSYYALDITNPYAPVFLWEFTDPKLGYSYSGPAFITRKDGGSNENYIMFLSGPSNSNGHAAGNQELVAFFLKVDDNFNFQQLYTVDSNIKGGKPFGNINMGFGGRLFTNGIDYNDDGETDAVFFGANWITSNNWKGDVFLVAPTDDPPLSSGNNPDLNWTIKNVLNEGQVPITAKIEHGGCYGNQYIYFGSGRWFYKLDTPGNTNANDTNALYGIQIDDCMQDLIAGGKCTGSFNNTHSSKSGDDLCDNSSNNLISGSISWKYDGLEHNTGGDYFMERVITDPTVASNQVFFTSMEPSSDICDFGGRTRLWGFNCRTGHDMWDGCNDAKTDPPPGSLLLQLSGGNIEDTQLNLESFTEEGNKATDWFTGVPPESGTPFVPLSGKLNGEILLWIER
jgi:type IV pilus assembly protein PilY1